MSLLRLSYVIQSVLGLPSVAHTSCHAVSDTVATSSMSLLRLPPLARGKPSVYERIWVFAC